MKVEAKGLVLCDYHADKFGMRDPDSVMRHEPAESAISIYVAFAPSTEPVPTGAVCDATLGTSAKEHDGMLAVYTIQRVDARNP